MPSGVFLFSESWPKFSPGSCLGGGVVNTLVLLLERLLFWPGMEHWNFRAWIKVDFPSSHRPVKADVKGAAAATIAGALSGMVPEHR